MTDWLIIKARRVDTDDVAESSSPVTAPTTPVGQRIQLTEFVRRRYPDVEFRSFHDEVASFLGRKLLIVARYRRDLREDQELGEGEVEERLF